MLHKLLNLNYQNQKVTTSLKECKQQNLFSKMIKALIIKREMIVPNLESVIIYFIKLAASFRNLQLNMEVVKQSNSES